jgi:hypothetical protein
LQQFKGASEGKIAGIDIGLITSLSTIAGLVNAFDTSATEIKTLFGCDKTNKALQEIKESDDRSEVLRMRLGKAKMGVAIELADTFSWLFAIMIKYTTHNSFIRRDMLYKDYSFFEKKIIDIFAYDPDNKRKLVCYLSKQRVCACKYY